MAERDAVQLASRVTPGVPLYTPEEVRGLFTLFERNVQHIRNSYESEIEVLQDQVVRLQVEVQIQKNDGRDYMDFDMGSYEYLVDLTERNNEREGGEHDAG